MKRKPVIVKWTEANGKFYPVYDFTSSTRRDPPHPDEDCKILTFPLGTMHNGCWISI